MLQGCVETTFEVGDSLNDYWYILQLDDFWEIYLEVGYQLDDFWGIFLNQS